MSENNLLYEQTLFERFRQGDERAFKVLYDRYSGILFATVRAIVRQQDVAEDVVANAFIKLYECRMRMRDGNHVQGFLFVTARNEAVVYYRDQKRQRVARVDQEVLLEREYHDPVEAELEMERWMTKVRALVREMPPARRQIFELNFFKGLSVREIANQLNLTETTVRNQRNRALSFLRQAFFL